MRAFPSAFASAALTLVAISGGGAQAPPARFERLTASSDTSQHFALTLPAGYSRDRRWPLLILMDPRGRALVPLECFSPLAEQLGYIVMSSYNTRSDERVDPNPAAVNAMLAHATSDLSIDESRLYLAGFSGTARAAWMMAAELKGHVAGIVGFGGGLPPTTPFAPALLRIAEWDPRFSVAGGAGVVDFNYLELVELADSLDAVGLANQIQSHPGRHAWPGREGCEDALRWLHARAMRTGLAPKDSLYAIGDRDRRRQAADHLRTAGDPLEAATRLRSNVDLYAGWLDVSDDEAALTRLTKSREFSDARKARSKELRTEREWLLRARKTLTEAGRETNDRTGFDPKSTFTSLDGPKLLAAASDSTNRLRAQSSARRLEWLFVTTAFYQPRTFLEREKPAIALSYLGLAERIRPLVPEACRMGVAAGKAVGDSAAVRKFTTCDSSGSR